MKTGKIACYCVLILLAEALIFTVVLSLLPDQMTISQMAEDAGMRDWKIIAGTGVAFAWLFVHLFWRWKNVWRWIKDR